MMLRTGSHQFSGTTDFERVDEADRRRYLMRRQIAPARGEDITLQSGGGRLAAATRPYHDLGDDDRAGERALARLDLRHLHRRVPVNHRLDLFRVHLESTDIDNTAAPAHKMAAT